MLYQASGLPNQILRSINETLHIMYSYWLVRVCMLHKQFQPAFRENRNYDYPSSNPKTPIVHKPDLNTILTVHSILSQLYVLPSL